MWGGGREYVEKCGLLVLGQHIAALPFPLEPVENRKLRFLNAALIVCSMSADGGSFYPLRQKLYFCCYEYTFL
jgi:hypothetical protein